MVVKKKNVVKLAAKGHNNIDARRQPFNVRSTLEMIG